MSVIDTYSLHINSPKSPYYDKYIVLNGNFAPDIKTAYILFVNNKQTLKDSEIIKGKKYHIYTHDENWDAHVDMLRNEQPVSFRYYDHPTHDVPHGEIYTGDEPIGDGEGTHEKVSKSS